MNSGGPPAVGTAVRVEVKPVPPQVDTGFRPEIQGLRAVAVALVVVFHLWPRRLGGGYVGVDVFFVISGYLITSHLFREVARTTTVDVVRFWARRIRRLLPASFLVLLFCAVATVAVVPMTRWPATVGQITASALYVQNWALQRAAVDYLAREGDGTLVQHYWSLSVEEQFYVAWPLLVVAALWLYGRAVQGGASTEGRRRAVALTLALVAAASFTVSVVLTAQDASVAYFSTLTRAWEFAVGALAALLTVRPGPRARLLLGWAGLLAVLLAAVFYTQTSRFPGWIAALPVLGAAAVILSGTGSNRTAGWWLGRGPATAVGDISYAIYLWHWPLIVLAPYVTGHVLHWPDKIAVIALTLALAWTSTTWIENPLRTRPLLAAASRRAFAFAAVGMLTFTLGYVAVGQMLQARQTEAAARLSEAGTRCLGPHALADPERCRPVEGEGLLIVPADVVAREGDDPLLTACRQTLASDKLLTCTLGTASAARRTVALFGDSHAGQWMPMLDEIGKQLEWKVIVYVKAACPMSLARRVLDNETGDANQLSCEAFTRAAIADVRARPDVTDVFVAARPGVYRWTSVPGHPLADPATDGFTTAWQQLTSPTRRLHLIAATPFPEYDVPTCLTRHPDDVTACSTGRAEALHRDDQRAAAAVWTRGRTTAPVSVIDLTDELCDARWCYARIGSLAVYRDRNHLSLDYARLLAPFAIAQLPADLRTG